MPKIQYLHKTRQGIPGIYAQKFSDILQNMNFSRCYRNRGKFIYGFDPNIIKYINKKRKNKRRINSFSVFSHGFPDKLAFGYLGHGNMNELLSFKISDIKNIKKQSFSPWVLSMFYSCRSAEGGNSSFASKWVNKVGGVTFAYIGRSDYTYINKYYMDTSIPMLDFTFNKVYNKVNGLYNHFFGKDREYPQASENYPIGKNAVLYKSGINHNNKPKMNWRQFKFQGVII